MIFLKRLFLKYRKLLLILFTVVGSKLMLTFVDLSISNFIGSNFKSDSIIIALALTSGVTNFVLLNIRKLTISNIESKSNNELFNFCCNNSLFLIIVISPILVLSFLFPEIYMKFFFKNLSLESIKLLPFLIRSFALALMFNVLSNQTSIVLEKKGKAHLYPFSNMIYALTIIIFIMFFVLTKNYIYLGLSYMFGSICQFLFILYKVKLTNFSFGRLPFKSFSLLLNSIFPIIIIQIVNETAKLYEKSLSIQLGEGVMSIYYYSNKINLSIIGIIITVLSYYYLSKLSDFHKNNIFLFKSKSLKVLKVSSLLLIFLIIFLNIFGDFIINNTVNYNGLISNEDLLTNSFQLYNNASLFYCIIQVIIIIFIAAKKIVMAYIPVIIFAFLKIILLYVYSDSLLNLTIPKIHLFSLLLSSSISLIMFKKYIYDK